MQRHALRDVCVASGSSRVLFEQRVDLIGTGTKQAAVVRQLLEPQHRYSRISRPLLRNQRNLDGAYNSYYIGNTQPSDHKHKATSTRPPPTQSLLPSGSS